MQKTVAGVPQPRRSDWVPFTLKVVQTIAYVDAWPEGATSFSLDLVLRLSRITFTVACEHLSNGGEFDLISSQLKPTTCGADQAGREGGVA